MRSKSVLALLILAALGGTLPASGQPDSSVYNVKDFGATGDGVTDDTGAIQAAINAVPTSGGIVFLPVGAYKVTTTITLKDNVTVRGAKRGRRLFGTNDWQGTVLDARTMRMAGTAVLRAINNSNQINIESLSLRGAGAHYVPAGNPPRIGVTGIDSGHVPTAFTLRDLYIEGFSNNIFLDYVSVGLVDNVVSELARSHALVINGGAAITVVGGLYANSGQSPNSTDGNIYILNGAFGIVFLMPIVDEGGHASVNIGNASDITFIGGVVFSSSINSNGIGPGYGFKLGDGTNNPTRVSLIGVRVTPFSASLVSTNTILIYGTGHRLVDVTTNPNGGGDIRDNATDTFYVGVNGRTVNNLTGLSATSVAARNLRGSCTFSFATTCSVTFGAAETDASYFVALGCNADKTFWVTDKGTGGFTINASLLSSDTCDWVLVR